MKKNFLVTAVLMIALVAAATGAYVYVRNETTLLQPSVSGTVTKTTKKSDGTLDSVTVKNTDGDTVLIRFEATELDGITCLNPPDIADGDSIEFKLPEAHFDAEDYLTCYETSSKNYYINVK